MADQFVRVPGVTELYDVVRGGRTVGMVWLHRGVWHAALISMANPTISEPSRELAAAKL
ncbi:hypothetical protein [Sphingomonas faeni]|uniref:hypothetical protein n=1 Tax=Sphingomonas faeni TaxID=185950 RepID=UPI003350B2AA